MERSSTHTYTAPPTKQHTRVLAHIAHITPVILILGGACASVSPKIGHIAVERSLSRSHVCVCVCRREMCDNLFRVTITSINS